MSVGVDTIRTRVGAIIGTIAYMSPEQARGEIVSPAADIFSFGVMLQHLLTGIPARTLDGSMDEMLEVATRGTVDQIRGKYDRDVVRLIGHLTRPNPHDRPSATSALERLVWIRDKGRRRIRLTVASITILLAFGAVTKHSFDLRRERNLAFEAREAETVARKQAQDVADFMIDLFSVSDPSESRGNSVTARELLDRAAENLHDELEDAPSTRAKMMRIIGTVYRQLGLFADAEGLLDNALAIRQETGVQDDIAGSLAELASLYLELRRYEEAIPLFQESITLHGNSDALRSRELASAKNNLAIAYRRLGRFDEAIETLEDAIAIREELDGPNSDSVATSLANLANVYQAQDRVNDALRILERVVAIRQISEQPDEPALSRNLNNLGTLYSAVGRGDDAEDALLRALALDEKNLGQDHVALARVLNNLASFYSDHDRLAEAEPLLERALKIFEAAFGPDRLDVAIARFNLGDLHRRLGHIRTAEQNLQQAAAFFDRLGGQRATYLPFPLLALAQLREAEGRPDQATHFYKRTLELQEATLPAGHEDLLSTRTALAEVLRSIGRTDEAAEVLAKTSAQ